MKKSILVLSSVVVLFIGSAPEASALDLAVVGGLNMASQSTEPNIAGASYSSKSGLTFGALLGLPFLPGFGLEIGALFMKRKIETTLTSTTPYTTTASYLEVPALLRFNLLPVVSVGAGLYYATGQGDVVTQVSGSTTETKATFAGSNLESSDLGVVASARAGFGIIPLMDLIVDLRYQIGLKDVDTSATGVSHFKDLQLLAGVKVGF